MSCEDPSAKPEVMPRKPKYDKEPVCVRCRNADVPASIVVRHSVYCRECFVTQLGHKLRRCLEPTINADQPKARPGSRGVPLRPVLKAAGNLVMGYSGGSGSSLLLDLIHETYFTPPQLDPARGTKAKSKRENVWPIAYVAFIDTSAAYPGTPDRTEDARQLVARYPRFEFIPLRIENAFDPLWADSVGLPVHHGPVGVNLDSEGDLPAVHLPLGTSPSGALLAYLSSQPSSSARTTALRNLTRLLLQYTARHTKSSHLLLGGSLTSYAVDLLDSVATGAGFSIRQVGEETWEGIRIVRPLREITDKEVAAGCWWRRVEIMPATVKTREDTGITKLTKDFITGLDRDFPSTVHTIARTCEKLAFQGEESNSSCPLCERPVQPGVQAWKTQIAIRTFEPESRELPLSSNTVNPEGGHPRSGTLPASDPVSGSLLPPMSGSVQRYEPIPTQMNQSIPTRATPTLAPLLCYSCHTQLTSRGRVPVPKHASDHVALPVWVRSENILRDYLLESE